MEDASPAAAMTTHDGLGLPAPLSPATRPLADLALYPPRFVWPPAFRGTYEWAVLREDIATHGIRTPLRILRNGWIIDGTHRFLIAQELRLERVPVQIVPLALARAPAEPLSDFDRLRIERTAVRETIGRDRRSRSRRANTGRPRGASGSSWPRPSPRRRTRATSSRPGACRCDAPTTQGGPESPTSWIRSGGMWPGGSRY